jgi:REP element-mobilizing transposase RayT
MCEHRTMSRSAGDLVACLPIMKKHYWERRLPHWIPDETPIFVTWRLAGSLPIGAGRRQDRLRYCPKTWGELDAELDHASGPRWLAKAELARIVQDALLYGEASKKWYTLHAWVVMPNHVHVVMTPHGDFSEIMRWLKWTTARRVNALLGRTGTPFWQIESYDHWIRTLDELGKTIRYVETNAIAAGLENWPWSSASAMVSLES